MAEPMSRADRAAFYGRMLEQMGYAPAVYEGEVRFKHEGGTYQILVFDDQEYVSVTYPRFWPFDPEKDLARVEMVALTATTETKAAKVLITKDRNVSAAVELFCSPPQALQPVLPHAIASLKYAVSRFKEGVAVIWS